MKRPLAHLRSVLFWEAVPDSGSRAGFLLLLLVILALVSAAPDRQGFLYGWLLDWFPRGFRGPRFDVSVEAVAQSLLLVGPPLALLSGVRNLVRRSPSFLPAVTAAGSGFLCLLCGVGLAGALLR